MFKKFAVVITLALFVTGGIFSSVRAESLTIQQMVESFISLGIIPADKAGAARAAIANTSTASTKNVSSVRVLSPNGGEIYSIGTQQTITWTGGQFADGTYPGVDISLLPQHCSGVSCVPNTETWHIITTGALTISSFKWTVGQAYYSTTGSKTYTVSPGNYYVRVCASGRTDVCDTSDSAFTVNSQTTTQPSITVTYPQAGYTLVNGGKDRIANILWSTKNFSNLQVNVALIDSNGSAIKIIAQNVPNTGSYVWQNDPLIPSGQYQILLGSSDKGPSAESYSGYFVIQTVSTQAQPVISSVSGPTSLVAGQTGSWTISALNSTRYAAIWADGTLSTSVGGSGIPSESEFTSTSVLKHTFTKAGTYYVQFFSKGADFSTGGTGSKSVTVTVTNPIPATPTISVAAPTSGTVLTIGKPFTVNYIAIPNKKYVIALTDNSSNSSYSLSGEIAVTSTTTQTFSATIGSGYNVKPGSNFVIEVCVTGTFTCGKSGTVSVVKAASGGTINKGVVQQSAVAVAVDALMKLLNLK